MGSENAVREDAIAVLLVLLRILRRDLLGRNSTWPSGRIGALMGVAAARDAEWRCRQAQPLAWPPYRRGPVRPNSVGPYRLRECLADDFANIF